MILRVSVSETEVQMTTVTGDFYQLLHLTPFLVTPIGIYLPLLHCWVTFAVIVYVCADSDIRHVTSFDGHRSIAERTNWHLDVLLVRRGALMLTVCVVVLAENFLACVALHWQEIHLSAETFRAMLSEVWKLHFDQLSGCVPAISRPCDTSYTITSDIRKIKNIEQTEALQPVTTHKANCAARSPHTIINKSEQGCWNSRKC